MRGRKRTPTALNKLRGNPGKRRKRRGEPRPDPDLPPPPAEFQLEETVAGQLGALITAGARACWDHLVPELHRLGLLTKIDRGQLAAYCTADGMRVYCLLQIKKYGTVIKTGQKVVKLPNGTKISSGGTMVQSPWVGMHNQAVDKLVRIAAEFGMTPASRARIEVHDLPAGKSAGEAYLEGKGL